MRISTPPAHCPPLPAVETPSARTVGGSKLTDRQKDVLREIVRDASVTSEHLADALGLDLVEDLGSGTRVVTAGGVKETAAMWDQVREQVISRLQVVTN